VCGATVYHGGFECGYRFNHKRLIRFGPQFTQLFSSVPERPFLAFLGSNLEFSIAESVSERFFMDGCGRFECGGLM